MTAYAYSGTLAALPHRRPVYGVTAAPLCAADVERLADTEGVRKQAVRAWQSGGTWLHVLRTAPAPRRRQ